MGQLIAMVHAGDRYPSSRAPDPAERRLGRRRREAAGRTLAPAVRDGRGCLPDWQEPARAIIDQTRWQTRLTELATYRDAGNDRPRHKNAGAAGATADTLGNTVPGPGAVIGVILLVIWGLAVIVPSLALVVRRLHDVNFSAWMILIGLVPFIGGLALLVFMVLPSKPEGQRFDVPAV